MKLTKTEMEYLKYLPLSNKQIADILIVNIETVKRHIHDLLKKFGAKNRCTVLIQALKLNLIKLEEIISDVDN